MNISWNISTIYALTIGGVIVVLLLSQLMIRLLQILHKRTGAFLAKHVHHPHLFRHRLPLLGRPRRVMVLGMCIAVTTNTLCIILNGSSSIEIASRAALMFVVNIALQMLLSIQPFMHCIRMTRYVQQYAHAGLGLIAFAEGTAHVLLIGQFSTITPTSQDRISGIVAGSCLVAIILISVRWIRNRFYESFHIIHYALTTGLMISLWLHVGRTSQGRPYIILWAGLLSANLVSRSLIQAYCTFTPWGMCARARLFLKTNSDMTTLQYSAIEAVVELPRHLSLHPGQYLYISVPKASYWSLIQRHPFMAYAWQEHTKTRKLRFIIPPKRGFTEKLARFAAVSSESTAAFVEGPYGRAHDFSDYGTVVMISEGLGIMSHLAHVRDLMRGYRECMVKTRHLRLIWQPDFSGQQEWFAQELAHVLEAESAEFDIRISIHITDVPVEGGRFQGAPKRIMTQYRKPDIERELKHVLGSISWGRIAIAVSAYARSREHIRDVISMLDYDHVWLVESEYQPDAALSGLSHSIRETSPLEIACKGV